MFGFVAVLLKQVVFLVSYVSNGNSFPKPLSAIDERKYLRLFKEGDMDARNVLIERNLRLVAHIVKKYSASVRDSDDLISIGTIGLIKAIGTFDNAKGTRLATYASRCIENATTTVRQYGITSMGYLREKVTRTHTFVSAM